MPKNRISRYLAEPALSAESQPTSAPAGFAVVQLPQAFVPNDAVRQTQQDIYQLAYLQAVQAVHGDPDSSWYSI